MEGKSTVHARVSDSVKALIDAYADAAGISRSAAAAQIIERGLRTLNTKGFAGNCCGGRLFGFCAASATCGTYPITGGRL